MYNYHYNHKKPHVKTRIRIQHILHYMALGKSDAWIAKHIGVSVKTIRQYRCRDYFWKEYERIKDRLPDKINHSRNLQQDQLDEIKKLHSAKLTNGEIARHLACSPQRICAVIKRMGLTPNGKTPEKYSDAEITEMIRLRVEEKLSYKEIAKRTGHCRSHISRKLKECTFESFLHIPRNELKKNT